MSTNRRRYSEVSEKYFLLILALIFLVLTFIVIRDLFTVIIFSFILSYFLYPVYEFYLKRIKDETISAIMTLLSASVFIFLPITLLTYFISLNLLKLVTNYKTYLENPELLNATINEIIFTLTNSDIISNFDFSEFFQTVLIFLLNTISHFFYSIPILIMYFLISLFITYYIFINNKKMLRALNEYIPLTMRKQNEILRNVQKNIKVLFKGYFLTGLIQTLIAMFFYIIFGAPNILIITFLTLFVSIMPYVGSPIVWGPVGIYMILSGNTVGGYGLLIAGTLIISLVDNFLRPYLMSDEETISPPLVFLGLVGGLFAFGIAGIIIGPIIISITAIVLRYLKEFYELRYEA
jgi:predicted PurR-regulated permease PerM